ncbi:MAG: hypothetical protein P8189_26820 [Anaerolineae bacterium]
MHTIKLLSWQPGVETETVCRAMGMLCNSPVVVTEQEAGLRLLE